MSAEGTGQHPGSVPLVNEDMLSALGRHAAADGGDPDAEDRGGRVVALQNLSEFFLAVTGLPLRF